MTTSVVMADGLTLDYRKKRVFDNEAFAFAHGCTALLGPNGAGKSTLLRAIVGLKRASAGRLVVLGHEVTRRRSLRELSRVTSFLPQQAVFDPRFTVLEHVEFSGWLKGMSGAHLRERARTWTRAVGLANEDGTRMGALSGGMARRATIAGAMVCDPQLLVLDEPTVGLDPAQRASFRELISHLSESTSVLLSTHLVEDVASVCERVAVLDHGHVMFSGSIAQFSGTGAATPHRVDAAGLERAYLETVKSREQA